jgi:hypothetical protein
MRWRVYLFCALTWLFLLPPSLAHAEKTLQERYLEIYVGIHDADQFEQQGDYRSALKAFEDCYTKLQAIHESNPDWEPAMVNARLNDFKVKIADLKPKAEAQQSVPAAQPTPTPTPSELSDDPVVLKQDGEVHQFPNRVAGAAFPTRRGKSATGQSKKPAASG